MWRNLVYWQNVSYDCVTESLWNKTAFSFAPWECLISAHGLERSKYDDLLLPANWFIHSWSVQGSSSHRRKNNFFFFHFLRGFFRCLIILLSVSSCLCQQMSHQLDLTFLCSLADGESVWPWWLLLCKVRQALPLPCIWCINPSALALCTCFRINTESSYSISLFLLFFESSLTEVSYFIQIMQKPLQSFCSVFTSCLTVW